VEAALNPRFTVRPVEPRDLPAIAAIESASLPWAAHWTGESYLCEPQGERWARVAESDRGVVGFVLARWTGGEMEILNLAVHPTNRRQGAGRALAAAAVQQGAARGAAQVFLEVRASNLAALAFYARLGFTPTGRRPAYYQEPREDAVLMARAIAPA